MMERPEDVMNQLSRFHAKMVASGVWSSILRQFFVDIFQIINVRLFNAIAERSDLCTLDNGMVSPLLSLYCWEFASQDLFSLDRQASSSKRRSPILTNGQTMHPFWMPSPPSTLSGPRGRRRLFLTGPHFFLFLLFFRKQLAHVNEVASFLVAEDTQLLEMDFRVLGPRHLIHFASTRSKS